MPVLVNLPTGGCDTMTVEELIEVLQSYNDPRLPVTTFLGDNEVPLDRKLIAKVASPMNPRTTRIQIG